MLHASTPIETTPFAGDDERWMLRDVVVGVLLAMALFAVVTTAIVRLSVSDESWGYAIAAGGFAGFWAGLFFGSAAGIIVYQRHLTSQAESPLDPGAISEPGPASGSGATLVDDLRTAAHP